MTTTKSYDFLNRLTAINSVSSVAGLSYSYNSTNQRTAAQIGGASFTSPQSWA